jgi:hypothetical protein
MIRRREPDQVGDLGDRIVCIKKQSFDFRHAHSLDIFIHAATQDAFESVVEAPA